MLRRRGMEINSKALGTDTRTRMTAKMRREMRAHCLRRRRPMAEAIPQAPKAKKKMDSTAASATQWPGRFWRGKKQSRQEGEGAK